jgi:hypothetical protein
MFEVPSASVCYAFGMVRAYLEQSVGECRARVRTEESVENCELAGERRRHR